MAMCGALCYSELAIRFPESGGEYVYLRAGYGEQVAFLYGWMSSIVMYPGVVAALAVGVDALCGPAVTGRAGLAAFPALLVCVFGAINVVGTRFSAAVMSFVNGFKLVILFPLVAWAVVSGHAHVTNLLPFTVRRPGSDPLFPAVAGGVISAFFSFGGWWEAGKIAGEIRNPRRTLPTGIPRRRFAGHRWSICSSALRSSLCCPSIKLRRTPPLSRSSAGCSSAQRAHASYPPACCCAFLEAWRLTMAAPRVCYAMAKSGAFFPVFGKLHPRFGTPANAILLQNRIALAVLFFGAFDRVLSYIIFSAVLFLALAASTLFA